MFEIQRTSRKIKTNVFFDVTGFQVPLGPASTVRDDVAQLVPGVFVDGAGGGTCLEKPPMHRRKESQGNDEIGEVGRTNVLFLARNQ